MSAADYSAFLAAKVDFESRCGYDVDVDVAARLDHQCRECRGTWRTEYVDTNGDRLIIRHGTP